MIEQKEMEKCTIYTRRGDRCEIKCRLGLWSVDGLYGHALINEANHYFQQYKSDGEYDKLLTPNGWPKASPVEQSRTKVERRVRQQEV